MNEENISPIDCAEKAGRIAGKQSGQWAANTPHKLLLYFSARYPDEAKAFWRGYYEEAPKTRIRAGE